MPLIRVIDGLLVIVITSYACPDDKLEDDELIDDPDEYELYVKLLDDGDDQDELDWDDIEEKDGVLSDDGLLLDELLLDELVSELLLLDRLLRLDLLL